MKKKIAVVLLISVLMLASTAIGVTYNQEIKAFICNANTVLNGNHVNLINKPIIYNGDVYISAKDIAQYTNYDAVWIEQSNTLYIMNRVGRPIINPYTPNNNNTTINNFVKTLNTKYGTFNGGKYDLEFSYNITNYVNYVKVKGMGEDFDKNNSKWKKRDKEDFKQFAKNILIETSRLYQKDSKIYFYDDDSDVVGEYEYIYEQSKFKVVNETLDFSSTSDAEDTLEDNYGVFEGDEGDLKFKYDVTKYSYYIKVVMEGQNFDRTDDEWDDRGVSDFRDFVEDFAEQMAESFDKDIKIYVEDEDDDSAAKYIYDEDDEELNKDFEY
ncbi:stalk domain-containing protein [Clostridiaceae bacterium M8S5]|nr:stalk domain-containing protein [Clostridiaceae bacterium M8S5]